MNFWEIFIKLCNEKKVSPSKACESMGLTNAVLVRWRNGSTPRATTVQKVADYFGVAKEYLDGVGNGEYHMFDEEDIAVLDVPVKNLHSKLFGFMSEMTNEELDELAKYAEFILSKR